MIDPKTNGILTGLTDAQVRESRQRHGENILTPPARESLLKKFLSKFSDPLIIILSIACVFSFAISFYEYFGLGKGADVFFEPGGIAMAIFLATVLSFYFEAKADREFSLLNKVNDDQPVRVLRNGNTVEVPRRDVVVGDIVILSTGDEVPADGTLLEAVSLTLDESSLTGEPLCHKTTVEADFDKDATYPSNEVLRGTNVMEGHGTFRVERVGDATENGKVMTESRIDTSVKTPLGEQMDGLGRVISFVSYFIAAVVVAGRILMFFLQPDAPGLFTIEFGDYLIKTVMIAVALIVVSVPEGLPMAVALSLAYSMRRMLRTNNLVRKMHACETMGATTVICTDKTGTLTYNRMQVSDSDFFALPGNKLGDNRESRIIAEGIAVNSTSTLDLSGPKPKPLGNPTEGALLLWLHAHGIDYATLRQTAARVEELPFSTERKFMASIVRSSVTGGLMLYVKGAPEIVLGLCHNVAGDVSRDAIAERLTRWQQQGMRTLGFAAMPLTDAAGVIADKTLNAPGLTFLGIVAIADPVRPDVPAAVREVLDAGIDVKIVTGDTPLTAREIATEIGLWNDSDTDRNIITGPEFAALPDSELNDRIDDIKIISRARPADKKRLVEILQGKNHVVAVTGDGTNDAPALNAAHVGLSMGDGTSVAKEASDITIIDNSFSSIGRAVMWGRSLYRNIQRFIIFQMTVNVAACIIVLVGSFMGTESPLTVTQMLWVNLIMDTIAAVALASLPPSAAVMKEKPRARNAFIITPNMRNSIIGVGIAFSVILFGILYIFKHVDVACLTDLFHASTWHDWYPHELSPYELSLFFTIFVFFQIWNLFNVRAYGSGRSAFDLRGCRGFLGIVLFVVLGQFLIVTFGGEFFSVEPLKAVDWAIIVASTSFVLWFGELSRLLHHTVKP